MTKFYSNVAQPTTLAAPATNVATSLVLVAVSGFPASFPYMLVLDGENISQEIVKVTSLAGTTATVVRGQDGTTAVVHSTGASVVHVHTAADFTNVWDHVNNTSAHGATGNVVGEQNTQNLTNKTALAADAATVALVVKGVASQTAALLDVRDSTNATLFAVGADGTVTQVNVNAETGTFSPDLTTDVALTVNQRATSTENLVEVLDDSAADLVIIDKDGVILSATTTGGADRTTAPFCKLTRSTDQSIGNDTGTTVNFDVKDASTTDDDMSNLGGHLIEAQIDGTYFISASIAWAGTVGGDVTGRVVYIMVNSNRVAGQKGRNTPNFVGSSGTQQTVSAVVRLVASDAVTVNVVQDSGAPLALDSANTVPLSLSVGWVAP